MLMELGLFQPASTRHEVWQFSRLIWLEWPRGGQRPARHVQSNVKRRIHGLVIGAMGGLLSGIARKAAERFNQPELEVMQRPTEPLL